MVFLGGWGEMKRKIGGGSKKSWGKMMINLLIMCIFVRFKDMKNTKKKQFVNY